MWDSEEDAQKWFDENVKPNLPPDIVPDRKLLPAPHGVHQIIPIVAGRSARRRCEGDRSQQQYRARRCESVAEPSRDALGDHRAEALCPTAGGRGGRARVLRRRVLGRARLTPDRGQLRESFESDVAIRHRGVPVRLGVRTLEDGMLLAWLEIGDAGSTRTLGKIVVGRAVVSGPVDLRVVLHDRGGSVVDGALPSDASGEHVEPLCVLPVRARQRQLVGLRQMEHDVGDGPAFAPGRPLPPASSRPSSSARVRSAGLPVR